MAQDLFYNVFMIQGQEKTVNSWQMSYLSDYMADIGGIFTSVVGVATFLLAGFQRFISQKSMLNRLYGESDSPVRFDQASGGATKDPAGEFKTEAKVSSEGNVKYTDESSDTEAKELIRQQVLGRHDFTQGYCSYTLISVFRALCCGCCLRRCRKVNWCKRRMEKYQKFELAQERLNGEQDI